MSYREIEKKFKLPKGVSYTKAERTLLELYQGFGNEVLYATTWDYYWDSPGSAQFVRLRNSQGRTDGGHNKRLKEITTKKKDKGCNLDRLEINIGVEKIVDTKKMLQLVLGSPLGSLRKFESIVFIPDGTVISLCEVNADYLYVEVEGPSKRLVNKYCEQLLPYYPGAEFEPRSLFELFIQPAELPRAAK